MRIGSWLVVGMLLIAAPFVAGPARAGFDTNFTDPAGDTFANGAPPQGLRNVVDVTAGTSASTPTNITVTLTTVGTIGYPDATLYYRFETHGGLGTISLGIDGNTLACFACSYSYDYMATGGGSDTALIGATVMGNTLSASVPRAWGGDELTYLLTFSSSGWIGSIVDVAFDDGGQVNQPPAITNGPGPNVNVAVGASYSYTFIATDPENDTLTWSVDAIPTATWLSIAPGTGTLAGTPLVPGSWDVTVTVTDFFSNSDFHYFYLNAAACAGNTAPTITNEVTGPQTIGLMAPYTHDYDATDPQSDPLSWSVSGSTYATMDTDTGALVFFAQSASGTFTLMVTAADTCGNTDTSTLTIIVSSGGVGNPDGDGGGALSSPFNRLLIVLIIVVIVSLILAFVLARRRKGQGQMPPQQPPLPPPPPP